MCRFSSCPISSGLGVGLPLVPFFHFVISSSSRNSNSSITNGAGDDGGDDGGDVGGGALDVAGVVDLIPYHVASGRNSMPAILLASRRASYLSSSASWVVVFFGGVGVAAGRPREVEGADGAETPDDSVLLVASDPAGVTVSLGRDSCHLEIATSLVSPFLRAAAMAARSSSGLRAHSSSLDAVVVAGGAAVHGFGNPNVSAKDEPGLCAMPCPCSCLSWGGPGAPPCGCCL